MTRGPAAVVALLVLTVATRKALAHDPFEVTTEIRVEPASVTLETTMARGTAARLASGDATAGPRAFSTYRERVAALAPSLHRLVFRGGALEARAASAELTNEGDVTVRVAYGEPRGAFLRVEATHLGVLPEGHTTSLRVTIAPAGLTALKVLTAVDPAFDVPAPPLPPEPPSPSAGPRAAWSSLGWGLLLVASALGAAGVVRRLARDAPAGKHV